MGAPKTARHWASKALASDGRADVSRWSVVRKNAVNGSRTVASKELVAMVTSLTNRGSVPSSPQVGSSPLASSWRVTASE